MAALVGPYFLIEIEATAVKKKAGPISFRFDESQEEAGADATSGALRKSKRAPRLPAALRKKASLAHNANGDSRRG